MSDVIPNVILITNSTDVAHLVGPNSTLCGRWNFEHEWLEYDHDFGSYWGRNVNEYRCRVRRACDNGITGTPDKLCSECHAHVPDDRFSELFDTFQFAHIDGVDIGEYQSRPMDEEQWQENGV